MLHRRSVASALLALLVCVGAAGPLSGCSLTRSAWSSARNMVESRLTEEGRFRRVSGKAYRAQRSGDYQRAEKLYRKARGMRPDHAGMAFSHAVVLGRLGRDDEALTALQGAAALGYARPDTVEFEIAFRGLAEDPRFAGVLERVVENEEADRAALEEARRLLPPDSAASFESLAGLEETFRWQADDLERRLSEMPFGERLREEARFRVRRLAALRRYVQEHPDSPDREQAALEAVRILVDRAEEGKRWHEGRAADLRRAAEEFLAGFPDTEHGPEVRLYRLAATILGTRAEDHDPHVDPLPPPNCEPVLPELTSLAEGGGDKWSAGALGLRALCLFEVAPRQTEEIREAYEAYLGLDELPWEERVPFDFWLRAEVRVLRFRVEGLPPFAVTTLDRREVGLEAFRGDYLLLDFWAPG